MAAPGDGGSGCGGARFQANEAQKRAQAEGPDRDRWRLRRPPAVSNNTSMATTGNTHKRTGFDCHLSFAWSTPHPIVVLQEAPQMSFRGPSVYTHLRIATMQYISMWSNSFFGRPS